ncbi:MAG: hypothetical protein IJ560_01445 [Alphaproteobacteria bacterium]|nr:hypothetical protein [Alphaproteobacteria bacterium]
MEYQPDINAARKTLRNKFVASMMPFSEYSSAYVITNENLRSELKYMPMHTNRALVTTGSGDHPIFCALNGASHVDTFDVTYNAKCILDIKTAAFGVLSLNEYWQILNKLHYSQNIKNLPNMDLILPRLSPIVREYIYQMNEYPIFSRGLGADSYNQYAPLPAEYEIMRQKIQNQFPFIWSNIADLGEKLTESYDFIHTSNIFEYIKPNDMEQIISPLMNHTNIGGRIIMIQQRPSGLIGDFCRFIESKKSNWRAIKTGHINVLERER